MGWIDKLCALLVLIVLILIPRGADAQGEELWYFWGEGCSACRDASAWLDELALDHPQLVIRRGEVWHDLRQRDLYLAMLQERGEAQSWVPCFIMGERVWQGFNATIASEIEQALKFSRRVRHPRQAREWEQMSPVAATILIGLADGFNPCSMWVLTMLLAIVLHTKSRLKLATVGAVFLLITGGVYGLFIASIFTALEVTRHLFLVRFVVASLALIYAAINIWGYFRPERAPSLTIPPAKKPGLFRGVRHITHQQSLPAMLGLTAVFAAGATLVELPCTVGFPMVWTNMLAQAGIGGARFVGLLLLYLTAFLSFEAAIVALAVVSRRVVRLQADHGGVLKLVGGMLMATLAIVLLLKPALLRGWAGSLAVVAVALLAAGMAASLEKKSV